MGVKTKKRNRKREKRVSGGDVANANSHAGRQASRRQGERRPDCPRGNMVLRAKERASLRQQ